ncbi:protein CMS1 [Cryptococcus neoformans Ze90-1]|nr:protein CMS1 [Cryptococcus neoformans var. grubii Ze90-1]
MVQEITEKTVKTGGDDLDDGLELDPDLLASSDIEDAASDIASEFDGGEQQDQAPEDESPLVLEGEETEIAMSPVPEVKKRKAEDVEGEGEQDEEATKAEKKRRKKEKEKERKAKRRQGAELIPSTTAPTHLATTDLSSVLLRSIRESFPSSSAIEIEEVLIPPANLLEPPTYPAPKVDPSNAFKPLQQRISELTKAKKEPKGNGAPAVIVLGLSGLRCADIVRGVRDVKGKGEVAKLFAKHFKLADQIKYLERTKVSIAVGTPARVGKLLAEGAIKISKDTVLLLDIGHQDSKTRTILTLPEVRDELWKSVFSGAARKTLLDNGVKIGAF